MSDWLLLDLVPGLGDALPHNTKVVLEGVAFLSAGAAVIGCFALLKRRALTGDALSHAALPGLCLAFLLVGEREFGAMLLGAFLSGLLGILVIVLLRRYTRIKEDAAIGIVLGVFFGAGIVLRSIIQTLPTGSQAGLDSFILGKTAGIRARDLMWIRVLALGSVGLVALLYKECKLISFDPAFARVQGWPTTALDFLLMVLIAVAVVVGLPAVGVVMIVALLIIPAASARFWTERLSMMLVLAALFGMFAGIAGALISDRYGWPTGPAIILAAIAVFVCSVLLAPRRGGLARWLAQRRFQGELNRRQLLHTLYELAERGPPRSAPSATEDIARRRAWSPRRLAGLLADAEGSGFIRRDDAGQVALTESGLQAAARITREFRLWDAALRQNPELAATLTPFDTRIEEILPQEMVRDLGEQLRRAGRLPLDASTGR